MLADQEINFDWFIKKYADPKQSNKNIFILLSVVYGMITIDYGPLTIDYEPSTHKKLWTINHRLWTFYYICILKLVLK